MDMKSLKDLLEKLEIQIGEPSKSILARMEPPRSKPRSPEQALGYVKYQILKWIDIAGTVDKRELEAWLSFVLQVLQVSPDMDTFLALFRELTLKISEKGKQRRAMKKVDGKKNLGV